ncbi:MAG: shikimate dehydrogenase [Anaerolineales bacterium]
MIHLGLIGYPLGHSLSPKIHKAALKACDLQGDYSIFPIHPDDLQGLKDLLDRARSGEITGLNVTVPHKQNVIELMDELTPAAEAIGAVNTIYFRNNKLIADNTDAPGFLTDLKRFIGKWELGVGNRKSALVLGAGGSARAVVYALFNNGWNATLAARRIEQARELAGRFAGVKAVGLDSKTILPTNLQLIVNTTPVGMTPNTGQSPWPEELSFSRAAIYDLVYNPSETKLVKDARAQNLNATTGLGMLIEQAALAFEIWTGHNPPRNILYDSVVE